ncbi:hypothetical protein S40288_03584 [Stachybotrys chartarum IBT 40288]|nr:hypothetical protein S40288_03584 [Stachybotrys chartarum IBT 40288]
MAAANHRYSLPAGLNGSNGAASRPGPPPLPHIDDLLAVPKDIDSNQSIKRLLELAETSFRQAEMSREFNKPAQALKDYIRASIIAVQIIRSHRDYPGLRDAGDLARTHTALLKKISQQNDAYARIKQSIVADNKRTGVQPTITRQGTPQGNSGNPRPPSSSGNQTPSRLSQEITHGPLGKTKPAVQPKPASLHGNAINAGHGRTGSTSSTAQDSLMARFSNLKGPQSSPGQDPRIKTHAILPPMSNGIPEMPHSQKPKLSLQNHIHNIPSLPKLPDAIYSPARGSISAEATRGSAGTPRGRFSRTGSSTSLSSVVAAPQQTPNTDFTSPAQNHMGNIDERRASRSSIRIPSGDTITPTDLYQAMKAKGSVLLIDVRSREEFDEGHIMSSATICIEPSILSRENISADQISESLIISPNQEQALFDNRDKYELIVIYDQYSERIPLTAKGTEELVLLSLWRALVHFNYGCDLRNQPKLLEGGLEAWVDLMGPASLQSTAPSNSNSNSKPAQGLRRRNAMTEWRRSKYTVKPLRPDEVKEWQETLKKDEDETASTPGFLRTTEDFLRRFPPVNIEQESMTAPAMADQRPTYGSSHKGDLKSDLPSPPTRPAPALPRASYSSLSHAADDNDYSETGATLAQRTGGRPPKAMEQATDNSTKFFTGLNNPHNWCYANSTLQSLLASPDFGRELAESQWVSNYKVPKKDDEKIDHPQLMIRIMSNLFHWMSTGKFQYMKAQTLMDYIRHLCKHSKDQIAMFGSAQQQDAQEFMSFVLTNLHDETNSRRDRKGQVPKPNTKSQSLIQASAEYWGNHLALNQSIVDKYWRGLELSTVSCQECNKSTYTFTMFELIPVTVHMDRNTTLDKVLAEHFAPNALDDFDCESCRRHTRAKQSLSLSRMPPLLCVVFSRFHLQDSYIRKSTAAVTWDFNDFDFSPYFLEPSDCANNGDVSDKAFTGPFRYECYAVIVHLGNSVDTGHYYAYVRDSSTHDPYAWLCCNDSRVTKVRIGSGDRDDIQDDVFKSRGNAVPYMVFFRRKSMD